MALPKLDVPMYTLKLPSTGKEITYRPFLVKEEKILLMAMEGGDEKEVTTAIKQIINNCLVSEDVDVTQLAIFDLEYILLNLRARSTGDIIKLSYSKKECERENCKPSEILIDVNTIEIHKDKNHTNKIEITKDVGLIMKYPDVNLISEYDISSITENSNEKGFEIILKCIDQVYDADNVYSRSDYTDDELREFVEGFNKEQFEKVENFFETLPKMYKDVNFTCKECGYTEDFRLEGLASFFG